MHYKIEINCRAPNQTSSSHQNSLKEPDFEIITFLKIFKILCDLIKKINAIYI